MKVLYPGLSLGNWIYLKLEKQHYRRDVFYICREIDLMKTVNAYIMYIFGKIELSSIHAT